MNVNMTLTPTTYIREPTSPTVDTILQFITSTGPVPKRLNPCGPSGEEVNVRNINFLTAESPLPNPPTPLPACQLRSFWYTALSQPLLP